MSSEDAEYSNAEEINLYKDDPEWADLTPIPLPKREDEPFIIEYSPEYEDLFGYFNAILAKEEISERALKIVNDVISRHSTHYTAWWYKTKIMEKISYDPVTEMNNIDTILFDHHKSYQAWYFKQWLVDHLKEDIDQIQFLKDMFLSDAKNFHGWGFAIWYASRWNKAKEVYDIAIYEIEQDMRNNSAWNARKVTGEMLKVDPVKEFEDAAKSLLVVGKNEPACTFAIEMCKKDNSLIGKLREVADEMIKKNKENYFAYRLLLYIETMNDNKAEIERLCDVLIKLDPLRTSYYNLVKSGRIPYQ
ncbi:prenyltransferase alpha subunit [Histomonas meleagridis]|uniref:prenyltransferase alpha subunit n=1 Tax=Histomonas meleagridis TaxID=135588 RepID=UPI003559A621|nr:prenyltransferase alpha subunit [Histomonas meleagridis]KAH0806638.1 prenyltransferase alpha subunit [Histomonas meleagridis]